LIHSTDVKKAYQQLQALRNVFDDLLAQERPGMIRQWVEDGKVGPVPVAHYSDEYFYDGGAGDLEIVWMDEGTQFEIHEYDGSESIRYRDDKYWNVA
jgi:hypothetical protein